ncbi:hypothetical protein C8F04DRAFT_1112839, partial [Mycena alexandri]
MPIITPTFAALAFAALAARSRASSRSRSLAAIPANGFMPGGAWCGGEGDISLVACGCCRAGTSMWDCELLRGRPRPRKEPRIPPPLLVARAAAESGVGESISFPVTEKSES